MKWLSIVVLVCNEEKKIKSCISNLKDLEGIEDVEIIVADGNSEDATRELIDKDVVTIVTPANKSIQMNEALKVAQGKVIWYLHADMVIPQTAIHTIRESISDGYHGGGFSNIFDEYNDKIKRLGNIMNLRIFDKREQSDKGIFYGDNGIFIERTMLEKVGGIPEQAIMEDYESSLRLKKADAKMIKINDTPFIVSARRHIKNGFVKTRLQWIVIRKLYQWGISPNQLVKLYPSK